MTSLSQVQHLPIPPINSPKGIPPTAPTSQSMGISLTDQKTPFRTTGAIFPFTALPHQQSFVFSLTSVVNILFGGVMEGGGELLGDHGDDAGNSLGGRSF
jgi:hypothetical protein